MSCRKERTKTKVAGEGKEQVRNFSILAAVRLCAEKFKGLVDP